MQEGKVFRGSDQDLSPSSRRAGEPDRYLEYLSLKSKVDLDPSEKILR